MTLQAGDAQCSYGMAQRIYSARVNATPSLGIADDHSIIKADCYAIASGIVDEIQANARALIPAGLGGLQTTTGPGSPTGPHALPIPFELEIK